MSTENWWNNNNRRIMNWLEENQFQCYFPTIDSTQTGLGLNRVSTVTGQQLITLVREQPNDDFMLESSTK
jgi:hypothetical protein